MTYTLNIDKPALTLFKKLSTPIQRLLVEKAQMLKANPYAGAPLKGKYRLLRSLPLTIESTVYHLIYQVFERSETMVVRLAAPIGTIYRKLNETKLKPQKE
jgi:mRNA-degrading endonuclease RelE of RelBE toxin-antitoxin system